MSETRQKWRVRRATMGGVEDFDRCYRAVQSRDPRFDGWFFTAVTSTGVYCRPSCPALTPKRENVRFYATAAAAQQAGFRACLRCRPDAAPGSPEWLGRADVAARAVRLVLDGAVDRHGVAGLARRLGYSERQLHRVLVAEVGTGALSLARAQRAQTARLLIETTSLPMAQVAFAAGFASVRQFNDTVRAVFARTPGVLRKGARPSDVGTSVGSRRTPTGTLASPTGTTPPPTLAVRLAVRRPFAWRPLFEFLGARTVRGLERAEEGAYRRTLRLPHGAGTVLLTPDDTHVRAQFQLCDLRDLTTAITRCRRLCDLDADPVAVDEALAHDPALAPLVYERPGLRVPGSVDGFETAVRAVVGQQISVTGARRIVGLLLAACGDELPAGLRDGQDSSAEDGNEVPLTHVFPTPERLVDLAARRPESFPMPAARRRALVAVAEGLADGTLAIDSGAASDELHAQLCRLPGIGPWTASYVVLRALGDPDAFLAGDLGSRRAAEHLGLPGDPKALAAVSERWRPWRAYAQTHLWAQPAPGRPGQTRPDRSSPRSPDPRSDRPRGRSSRHERPRRESTRNKGESAA